MDTTKILLVDDQILFGESLKTVLEQDAQEFHIVGVAHNGKEAVGMVPETRPDIILMDVRMPEMDGVEATKIIHGEFPEIHIIMLTTFDDDKFVFEALEHGAVGYLLKSIPPLELITSIRAVRDGSVLLSPSIAKKLVSRDWAKQVASHHTQELGSQSGAKGMETLSPREIEILKMIGKGYGNRQITEELFLAEQTVRNHISNIYSKLGVKDRYEAMQFSLRSGIG